MLPQYLDISTDATGILPVFVNTLLTRIGVTACVLVGTLAMSILPAGHLHTSDAGRSFVHRHAIDVGADHGRASIGHGDHDGVQTLDPLFVSERQYDVERPLITAELVIVAPGQRLPGWTEAIDGPLRLHGPPIRTGSLRAPPA